MQNKRYCVFMSVLAAVLLMMPNVSHAESVFLDEFDEYVEDTSTQSLASAIQDILAEDNAPVNVQNERATSMDDIAAAAIEDYQVEGSLFEQITTLEQEKVLMQLEKERAQLDLELDRLAAEKIRLHMEIDSLTGRAEQQQQEFEAERARLEAEAARLAREKQNLENTSVEQNTRSNVRLQPAETDNENTINMVDLSKKYALINVVGAGNQLQATLMDVSTGQNKRVSVGKTLDGFDVVSISVEDGVVFSRDGMTQNLNVSSNGI